MRWRELSCLDYGPTTDKQEQPPPPLDVADLLYNRISFAAFSCTRSRAHLAHCALACMVASEVAGKYEELRTTYNSVIDEDCVYSLKVPPMEEWRDMTCVCDHLFCRCVVVFLSFM